MKNKIFIALVMIIWFTIAGLNFIKSDTKISYSERRILKQKPEITFEKLIKDDFINEFENYAADQFIERMNFRKIKAYTKFYLLKGNENNEISIKDGFAIKKENSINLGSLQNAAERFQYIYDNYLNESNNIYLSIIPDKGYFAYERYRDIYYNKL